jgi:uncharacterized protein YjiS (DUF1127 family)
LTAIHYQPCDDCPPMASRQSASRQSASRQPVSQQTAVDLLDEAARRVVYTLRQWRERIRGRNDLAQLDERALADIGLTPGDRDFLVNKPFWRE